MKIQIKKGDILETIDAKDVCFVDDNGQEVPCTDIMQIILKTAEAIKALEYRLSKVEGF